MNCPTCGCEIKKPARLVVTAETVADVYYEWMSDLNTITAKVKFVTVKNGTALPKQPLTEAQAEQP